MADDLLIRMFNNLPYQVPQTEGVEKIKEVTPRPEIVHEGSPPSEHVKEEGKRKREDKSRERKEKREEKEEEGIDIVI